MADLLRLARVEWLKLWRHRLTWGLLIALIVLFALQTRGLYAEVCDEPSVAVKVDEYMRAHVQAWPKWEVSAAVLVAREGQILVNKGYGLANRETGAPITPDTIFPLASISKQFTALAIVQLEEAGLLSVQDRLAKYYPEYPRSDEITLHHMLTHSSGLPNGTTLYLPDALEFDPGTQTSYSNLNYILLGHIVEQVSGQTLGGYLQERVFGPLEMRNSGFDPASVAGRPNAALGHVRGKDGPEAFAYPSIEHAGGAGALYSSAADLYRWDRALYTQELVSQAAAERIFYPHYPYEEDHVGYGWMIGEWDERPVAMHGGFLDGATGMIARFPEDDAVVIVLSNTDWAPVSRIAEGLAAILFGDPYELPAQHTAEVVDLDPAVFDTYAGVYELSERDIVLVVKREERRFLLELRTLAEQTTLELYPISETRFIADMGATEFEFIADETGAVNQLQVTNAGQKLPLAVRRGAAAAEARDLSDLNRVLGAIDLEPSFRMRLDAITLPGLFERLSRLYDWLIVSTILLGIVFVGQEFAWGTTRAALARGASRVQLMLSKLLAMGVLMAGYILILWLVCAGLGLWTTHTLQGRIDWRFVDGAFWLAQLGILGRVWLIALSSVALNVGIYAWVGRPGPAFSLCFLGYVFSLISYFFLAMVPALVLIRSDARPADFGDTLWARLIELMPHYSSRIVAYWGEPSPLYEIDHGMRVVSEIFDFRYDPLYAAVILVLYGLVPFAVGLISFKRREMRP
jgi:CubicO group peptidase (beta-lactamase class C family)/ABC-type transport system involved in multi-copper enzyme maturation permease subunit